MRTEVQEDFLHAAARLLPPDALAEVQRECLARVDDRLELAAEGSPEMAALQRARDRLAAKAAS
jgi:hypothetical protein